MSDHHGLPLLVRRQNELSKCAFCPKLCRATCVVSEAEPREALTPWGKMTNAFDAARGAAVDLDRAELAWGCSNCFRCREACDHRNPVADTLNEARAEYVAQGLAPPAVQALLEREQVINDQHRAAAQGLAAEPGVAADAPYALLLGCRYATALPNEARAAIRLTAKLVGPLRLLTECCGAWQRAAGAPNSADAARQRVAAGLGNAKHLVVFDPRCALELRALSPITLVELAARHAERFDLVPTRPTAVRYHDSCALGRGLGLYDEPRQLLARVTGATPLELRTQRELGRCSGAGGILPISMPDVSKAAAKRLVTEHEDLGGGTLVTGCASSLSRLRAAGAQASDLITLLEAGLGERG